MKGFYFTELCKKEVICESDGKKLGYPTDIEIDAKCGTLKSLILAERSVFGMISGRSCIKIPWCDVLRIGCDVIWVCGNYCGKESKNERNKKSGCSCCD